MHDENRINNTTQPKGRRSALRNKQTKTTVMFISSLTALLILSGCTSQPVTKTDPTEDLPHYGTFTAIGTATIPTTFGDNEVTIVEDPNTGCQYMTDVNRSYLLTKTPLYDEHGRVAGCHNQPTETDTEASDGAS